MLKSTLFLNSKSTIVLMPDADWNWEGWDGHLVVEAHIHKTHISTHKIIIEDDVPLFKFIPHAYRSKEFNDIPGMIGQATFMVDETTLVSKLKVDNFRPLHVDSTGTFECIVSTPSARNSATGPVPDTLLKKQGKWSVYDSNQKIFVKNEPLSPSAEATKLKEYVDKALEAHPDSCNLSTNAVAEKLGINDLKGKTASEQVEYMKKNWKTISHSDAQDSANNGKLAVAGYGEHTAVVIPGNEVIGNDKNSYPMIEGGASNTPYISYGDKHVGEVWSRTERNNVKYFSPPDPIQ
jgi:hypothetical protein